MNCLKLLQTLDIANIDIFKSILLSCSGHKIALVYKKVKLSIDKNAQIYNYGNFQVGKTWTNCTYFDSLLLLNKNAKMIINGSFDLLTECCITVNENAVLEIGSGYSNYNLYISCDNSIKIGNNVAIGPNVTFRDSDNHILHYEGYEKSKPIEVGENVWIGLNSTILKGVKIGSGSVIAAGSVVTKNIPENCLAGGVPARVLKENIKWS